MEAQAALYTGDAFHREWAAGTLDQVAALGAETLVGGRGAVARGADACAAAVGQTRHFLDTMLAEVGAVHQRGGTLKEAFEGAHAALAEQYGRWPIFEHCMPFNTSRLWDELSGIERPRIWTANARPRGLGRTAGLTRWRRWWQCLATARSGRPRR